MAITAGRLQRLAIDDGGGFIDLGCLVDATYNGETAELDTTCHDDDASRTFISGRSQTTIDFTLRWDEADAGQTDARDAFFARTTNGWRWRQEEGTGFQNYEAQGFVTSWSQAAPNDDVSEVTGTVRITGDVTVSTQA